MSTTWIRIVVQTWESDDEDSDITQIKRVYTLTQLQDMIAADRILGLEVIRMVDKLLPGEAPKV